MAGTHHAFERTQRRVICVSRKGKGLYPFPFQCRGGQGEDALADIDVVCVEGVFSVSLKRERPVITAARVKGNGEHRVYAIPAGKCFVVPRHEGGRAGGRRIDDLRALLDGFVHHSAERAYKTGTLVEEGAVGNCLYADFMLLQKAEADPVARKTGGDARCEGHARAIEFFLGEHVGQKVDSRAQPGHDFPVFPRPAAF